MNAITPAKDSLAWVFLKRSTSRRRAVPCRRGLHRPSRGLEFGDADTADGVLLISLQPDPLARSRLRAVSVLSRSFNFARHARGGARVQLGAIHDE
jgi:hypothetical protein